ncbi:hypothetical protein [Chroococcidiopsis sp.]
MPLLFPYSIASPHQNRDRSNWCKSSDFMSLPKALSEKKSSYT